MNIKLLALFLLMFGTAAFSQLPPIDPGVSQELAKWRSARYSDIRYKLDLTLEKMSPVLKGHMEIRVNVSVPPAVAGGLTSNPGASTVSSSLQNADVQPPATAGGTDLTPIVLDWRKLPGHENDSTITNVTINGSSVMSSAFRRPNVSQQSSNDNAGPPKGGTHSAFEERSEHLIFRSGVREGENVITLDFTSPILTSGSAITRYIDKEDGSEYIYSLFVPSDASTAFPVFDQPDLKAKFTLSLAGPGTWRMVSNTPPGIQHDVWDCVQVGPGPPPDCWQKVEFQETKPISTYVFAFAAGPWTQVSVPPAVAGGLTSSPTTPQSSPSLNTSSIQPPATAGGTDMLRTSVYVRRSQAAKFQPHAAETFRLTREAIKYLETYFDYKFPWPKYDLVLIPEFPFGGMEHAGATFLKESSVIFPTEPTKGDYISRANVIFHETAHQWFGDLVTMRWFDDLWLKEGFAEFMAYKTLEHVMPDANAWKVFYERNKQAAYATDSTRGTTPIYQPIANLSAAKSAYGNIVYRKAPSFLRQAEFFLTDGRFQLAIRAFLKKHAYSNASWQDFVNEFVAARAPRPDGLDPEKVIIGGHADDMQSWAKQWVTVPGVPIVRTTNLTGGGSCFGYGFTQKTVKGDFGNWREKFQLMLKFADGQEIRPPFYLLEKGSGAGECDGIPQSMPAFLMPNYGDYGYGIFLLDDKSRDYVLKHIGEEKDPFLRSMMWGALWDSVREAELDPREYVELVIKQLGGPTVGTTPPSAMSSAFRRPSVSPKSPNTNAKPPKGGTLNAPGDGPRSPNTNAGPPKGGTLNAPVGETDETTIQSLLGRVSTAMNYYLDATTRERLAPQFEAILLDRMQHGETPGQRITFYRAFVSNASTEHGRSVLKEMLQQASGSKTQAGSLRSDALILRTKDKFDIVTRLIVLGDADAPKLLAELEKTESSDDAKRYAYAAHAAFATAENRAKFWNDFVNNKDISESWIEAAINPFNSIRHPELSQPYLARALAELPNLKRTRKIFFINNWLGAWLSGQRDQAALDIVNKFLADNPQLDNDLRLKVLENMDVIERAVKIRKKWNKDVTTK